MKTITIRHFWNDPFPEVFPNVFQELLDEEFVEVLEDEVFWCGTGKEFCAFLVGWDATL